MMSPLDEGLRQALVKEILKRGTTVAYISSSPQSGDRPFYQSTIADYAAISPDIRVDYFDLSDAFTDETVAELPSYAAIYLSGGNTFTFMDMARRRGLQAILEQYLANGGVLIGASAGSIMCTPSIELAKFGDENEVGMTDFSGFGFVDFEFHPHFTGDPVEHKRLVEYQSTHGRDVYVCKDGAGLYVTNGEIVSFGDLFMSNNFTKSTEYLGKAVNIKIDRQLGSKHPKHDFVYELNYGFVPNTVAPDGEELDAYVLGVEEPVQTFTGRCIAIIHRTNDDDDKLIVVPEGKDFSDEEIRALTHFQERFFYLRNREIIVHMELLKLEPFQETLRSGVCGPASLKIVLDYYGLQKSEQELAEMTKAGSNGTDADSIVRVAESLGFRAVVKNESTFADIEAWLEKKVPVIVNWFTRGRSDYSDSEVADGHYSVVAGLDAEHIYLQDPEIGGIRTLEREDFMRVWFDFSGEYIQPDELIVRQLIAVWK